MSTPSITAQVSQLDQLAGGDPVLYTVGGSDQTIVVHIYISISPTAQNVTVGKPVLTYTDEWGLQDYVIEQIGSPLRLGASIPLRVKAGTTVSITDAPSGSGVYSAYEVVEVISAI